MTTQTLNELISRRAEIKFSLDAINAQQNELKKEQDGLDVLILKKMDSEGLSRTANDVASISINEDTVPEVEDWDALYAHILNNNDFSLLHRRVSSTAYKELLQLGATVPGLTPKTIRRLNFKKL